MKVVRYIVLFGILSGLAVVCTPSTSVIPDDAIRLNQLGYYPNRERMTVVDSGKAKELVIRDAVPGEQAFVGKSLYTAKSAWSDKTRTTLDSSIVTTPGKHILRVDETSVTFLIKDSILSSLADAVLKSFYYQRTATPIKEQYTGQWYRVAGHPSNHVLIHPNTAFPGRPAEIIASSSKGWCGAGDYNKYIVNSGYLISLM